MTQDRNTEDVDVEAAEAAFDHFSEVVEMQTQEVREHIQDVWECLYPFAAQAQAVDLIGLAAKHDLTEVEQGFITVRVEDGTYTATTDGPFGEDETEVVLELDEAEAQECIEPTIPVGNPDDLFQRHTLEGIKDHCETGRDAPEYGNTLSDRQRGMKQAYSLVAEYIGSEIDYAREQHEAD